MEVLPDVPKGSKVGTFFDHEFEVGCVYHRGVHPVGEETRIDPDTDEPRLVTSMSPAGDTVTVTQPDADGVHQPVVAKFPIYSEDIGYDPDCEACQMGLMNTYEHAMMREVAAARGALEWEMKFRAEAKERGLL